MCKMHSVPANVQTNGSTNTKQTNGATTMTLAYNELSAALEKRIDAFFPKKGCFIEAMPDRVIIPRKFRDIGDAIRQLPVHDDDVWMVSFPRTGSTWAQEMVWLLGHNLDYDAAKKQMQQIRSPLVELSALYGEDHDEWVKKSIGNTVDAVRNMPRPRFSRSHLPWSLLPQDFERVKPKIVYTARNPKDLCVSFYYYCKLAHGLDGSFEDFADLFLLDGTPMGCYWKHVLPFWKRSNDDNVLFLKYEDMSRDLAGVVRKCAKFLNVTYEICDADMQRICEHLNFDRMQSNPAVNLDPILKSLHGNASNGNGNGNDNDNGSGSEENKFMRKGKIGDWRNYISEELSARFDEWIDKNTRGSGLVFDYE